MDTTAPQHPHPLKSIIKPADETLKVWDKLSQARKVVGIGGVDAHAHKVNIFGFMEMEVFPYKVLFKSIRTHVLCDEELIPSIETHEFNKAKKNIYHALSCGRCFVSNYYHGEAKGFRYFAEDDNKTYQMGDLVPRSKNIKLSSIIPAGGGEVRLIYNGKEIDRKTGLNVEFYIKDKGVYRVEVYKEQNAWIFSNHIRIGV